MNYCKDQTGLDRALTLIAALRSSLRLLDITTYDPQWDDAPQKLNLDWELPIFDELDSVSELLAKVKIGDPPADRVSEDDEEIIEHNVTGALNPAPLTEEYPDDQD